MRDTEGLNPPLNFIYIYRNFLTMEISYSFYLFHHFYCIHKYAVKYKKHVYRFLSDFTTLYCTTTEYHSYVN